MRYRITHITEYKYSAQVSHCYNVAHIIPRTSTRQACLANKVVVSPMAAAENIHQDYFGNQALHFEIQRSHRQLVLKSTSTVETRAQVAAGRLQESMQCQDALQFIKYGTDNEVLLTREFVLDSPMIYAHGDLKAYAEDLFKPDKPLAVAVMELTQRIFEEFTYCPESTTISTPLDEVLKNKKGVCQDFAHLQIGCLRSLGIPAKYVSGYIETLPAPGKEKLVGSDASHAWVSAYCPNLGWVEFDPTNNCLVDDQHILTAWGRDYFDVTPLKGTIYGGGPNPILSVSVDVTRDAKGTQVSPASTQSHNG